MAKKKAREPTAYQKGAMLKLAKLKKAFAQASKNGESTLRQSEERDQRVEDDALSGGGSQNESHGDESQEMNGLEKDLEQESFWKGPEQDGFENDAKQDGFENDAEQDGFEKDLAQEDGTSQGSNNLTKDSVRGRTKFSKVGTLFGERLVVRFNEKGQPIGPHSVTYSSYLGGIARARVPISAETWHKVSAEVKDKYWVEVKKKFIVPEYAKKLTLKLIGKDWGGYKTQLRRKYYDKYDNDKDRIAACPGV